MSHSQKHKGNGRGTGWSSRYNRCHGNNGLKGKSYQGRYTSNYHPCPYKKWVEYMANEDYIPNSDCVQKIDLLCAYFKVNLSQFSKVDIEETGEVYIDYQALVEDTDLLHDIPSLKQDIKDTPSQMLNSIGLALHEAFLDDEFSDDSQSGVFEVESLHIRLLNHQPVTALKNLKASYFGKLVTVRGTVVRTGNVKPLVTKLAFSCRSCKEEQVINLTDGKYSVPTKCVNAACRGRVFVPLRGSTQTKTIDWQVIKLQEIMLDDDREAGRIPRTVECELSYNIVDCCVPGDVVTCTGIVKVSATDEGSNRSNRSKESSMYLLYLHAVSITNNKDFQIKKEGRATDSNDFTLKELYAIQEIQGETNLMRLVTGSLCPAIYGNELVKAGLVLALFGASQRYVDEKNNIPIRADLHVLVVGDPGLGKSQMLQAAANVSPRGVYVCGNTTTSSGLTVTLTKEKGSGDYALEAGALVLGDRGCCCIDEFDKMGNQHQALLEAMEQQCISIAKAGIVCSLPARTSILAAANPIGGHYDKSKTVSENLKMNSALLSRFDLVFILLDKPDEEMDGILSEHVMDLHTDHAPKKRCRTNIQSVTVERTPNVDELNKFTEQWQNDKPLSERLKISRTQPIDPIPCQLLRKYIQYARMYVHPKLSGGAAKVLQEFYLSLRKQYQGVNCTPVTTRQLEALIRLTEARARVELREEATEQDAQDVVEIMKNSLIDTFSDESGYLDFTRSQNGSGMSKRAQCKKFIAELNRISERENNSLFNMEQMYRIASQLKLPTAQFQDFIASLNNQNFLLKKGPRLYQLQTANCL